MYPAHIRNDGTEQTCRDHCRDVSQTAGKILTVLGLENTGKLAGLMHDCGKFTDVFSDYIKKAAKGEKVKKGSVIHTFAAVRFFLDKYHQTDGIKKLTSELLACADGSHHGLFDCYCENESGFDYRLNKQSEYDDRAIKAFSEECAGNDEITDLFEKSTEEIGKVLSKLRNLCDSNDKESELFFFLSMLTRILTSAVVDADRLDTACFMNDEPLPNKDDIGKVWVECEKSLQKYISAFVQESEIQKARRDMSDLCRDAYVQPTGIYRLDLPTGAGKTLSALRFALRHAKEYGKEHIYYISPLLSILDQNAEVIRKAIGHEEYILEHHSNVINEEKTDEELNEYELLTERWNSPIIITTLVQFLNTVFSGKMSSVRRFHSLQNSVVIIDEVQTVPAKMLTLFNLALNFLSGICGTTFILCSATQPEFGKIKHSLKPKELIPKAETRKYDNVFRRNEITDKGLCKLDEIPSKITELLQSYKSILVVCNKKDQSAELFSLLQGQNVKCFHLSAGMCMAHRKEVLSRLKSALSAKERTVCVSTQVIEAGVDISFDAVIRLCAGLDSIVQSAGRCNRNGEKTELAPVWVINCDGERLSYLKEISEAKAATAALFDAYKRNPEVFSGNLASDEAVRFYYNKLFGEKSEGHFDYTVKNKPSVFSMLAKNEHWSKDKYILKQAFCTAGKVFSVFDEGDQKSVIVPWRDGKQIIEDILSGKNLKDAIEKAKHYTVSVYEYQFERLKEIGAIREYGEIAILSEENYDENIGIKEVKNECSTLIL